MPIDPMIAARFHRNTRSLALQKQAHQAHIAHNVMGREINDPSLTNRRVYGNRGDWYASAAVTGWFDVEAGVEQGLHILPMLQEINAQTGKKTTGMSLYE